MSGQVLPVARPGQVRRAALSLVRADARGFAVVIGVNCAAAAAGLLGPWLVGLIVDRVQAGAGLTAVDELGLLAVAAAVAQFLAGLLARYLALRFGERSAARLREQVMDRILRLPARATDRAGTGDLTTRATTDVALVSAVLRDAAPEVLFALVQAAVIIVAVTLLSPLLALTALVPLTAIPLVLRWYLRRARSAYLAQSATGAALAEVLTETAAGARTVELVGLQSQRTAACADTVVAARAAQLGTLRLRSVFFPTIDVSTAAAVGVVFAVGGLLHLEGRISLGTAVAAALYARQVSTPLDTLLVWVETVQSALASFARLEGLAAPLQERSIGKAAPLAAPRGEAISIADVSYRYDAEAGRASAASSGSAGSDVLRGVSLQVRPGERLAIIGPSGAGKTTLGRLIAGDDHPHRGTVSVGGVPIADLPPQVRRHHVVMVTQDHHVFAESLRDNLLLTAPEATDAQLLAALGVVRAAWVDDLPAGLDTDLGSHRLSGAQAQVLALARVVLAGPHTIVLDEATALLDPRSARQTEEALAAAVSGRTTIAIAHRLSTARGADRVVVMAEGRIVEIGTHEQLLVAEGTYAAMWRAWSPD